ncbi:MAG: hypothetical protein ABR555_04505 [Pyrinomonadaceae bacterium]
MLKTVNIHDVVRRQMDPAGAKYFLTLSPESLPPAAIHSGDKAEREPFKRRKDLTLLECRLFYC